MKKLASIQRIINIEPIEGADNIVKATVLGWECVVKKDEFKSGDLCVYIQIDTVVPDRPEFEFLRERKFRVKTIKLKKQISQGLVLPLSVLPDYNVNVINDYDYYEGADVTDILGIIKYEKPDTNPVRYEKPKRPTTFFGKLRYDFTYQFLYRYFPSLRKKDRSPFPTKLVSITDEERIQNCPNLLEKYKGEEFIASYKLDGSSITIIHERNWLRKSYYRICSRRFELHNTNNDWYKVFKSTNFQEHIQKLVWIFNTNDIIVQGEAIGSFNGNHHNLKENEIRLFNIIVNGERISAKEFIDICQTHHIPHCPMYWSGKLDFDLKSILEFAQIPDPINSKVPAEGLVWRKADDSNVSWKTVNNEYLLQEK